MWPFKLKKRSDEQTVANGYMGLSDTLLEALFNPDYMTVTKAMQIPGFAGCVDHICSTAALIPIKLYKKEGETVKEVKDDVRVRLINDDTKDTMTGTDFKQAMMFDYLTAKGAYAYVNRSGSNWVSLHYIDQSHIGFVESVDPIFKDYDITVDGREYKPHEFIKFIRKTKNGYSGKSIIEESATILSVAYNSLLFENKNVKKGGNRRGFLQSERKLDQPAIDALKEAFSAMYSTDSESIPVLNNGVKFQEASMTSVELQINENKKQNDTEMCKLFGMPPSILAGGATNQDWIAYIQYCILPKLEVLCKAFDRDMLLEKEKGTYFFAADPTDYTKADIKTRFDAWATGLKSGFVQVDEIREKENLPAINFPYLKLGLQDVLYDPQTGAIYTPNTGIKGSITGGLSENPKSNDSAKNPAPQGPEDLTDQDEADNNKDKPGKEGEEGEDNAKS